MDLSLLIFFFCDLGQLDPFFYHFVIAKPPFLFIMADVGIGGEMPVTPPTPF